MTQRDRATILFTAFEPSGDFLGASVIAELRRRRPDLRIAAWGGPKMRDAGAEIVEETGHEAEMGLPGAKKIAEHVAMNTRIAQWVRANRPALHVPVDSPAANFPICKVTKASGAKVIHLAAPQVWAWARHRVNKLRRLTDLVLCLLPFEEAWFRERGVPAQFIGHPLFDATTDPESGRSRDRDRAASPANGPVHAGDRSLTVAAPTSLGLRTAETATPRIAFLPGSRPAEWRNNFPAMLDAFAHVRSRWPGAVGAVAASSEAAERELLRIAKERGAGGWPRGLTVALRAVDACIAWCHVALTVSGTVTLQIARQHKPMVVMYRIPAWKYWTVGRWIVRSEFATLPNLIAGRSVVPEFVPYTGSAAPLIAELQRLLTDATAREAQVAGLREVTAKFAGKRAAEEAAAAILRLMG